MAKELQSSDFPSENFLQAESANNEGTSLESTSEVSEPTQIEVAPLKVVQTLENSVQNVGVWDQSSSSLVPTGTIDSENKNESQDANFAVSGQGRDAAKKEGALGDEEVENGEENEEENDPSYEDDTISSEAIVDDIEFILMTESVQELFTPTGSPQLVRVTELKRPDDGDYGADVFENDETDQESDFKKFDDEDSERLATNSAKIVKHLQHLEDSDNQKHQIKMKTGNKSSGTQTEITALETTSTPFELKRKSSGKSPATSSKMLGIPGKRQSWKSELTLLPSKMKIRPTGQGSMNYQDQYSPRVAKFTSQDTLNSSSQFLKPSTLYRTRNLSRNLNNCDSSESTLVLPAAGLYNSTLDSVRYHERTMSSSTSGNFKESFSSNQVHFGGMSKRQGSGQGVSFRSSLPDLSRSPRGPFDNKANRRSFKSMKSHKSSSSFKLAKKSSSDDSTSSLIDESERCLRSSIDLLLTDDLPSPTADLSCRSTGYRTGKSGTKQSSTSHGYYSFRRSYSQPVLLDDGESEDLREDLVAFIPRKLSDMRLSKLAKVILPSGQCGVVAVKEMDEIRDTLTVHTGGFCLENETVMRVGL